ncbi:TIGR04211 family SH3 domain-containing protein [Parahaliea mediterranea]|uniref:TIGR04211 family SH3 domain-containing protein n=1 Tax=Parahaliea mediterranea TaxID=651086 RepID=UPI001F493427|nr:TIGR04211 family SH3 domain-containing protein [Parahaliea mediterranea]
MLRITSLFALLYLGLGAGLALAQENRYISDTQYIPLRSGAGNEYRIVHRGLPSGTRLTVHEESADGEWARITTAGGDEGWLRAQYLMTQEPAESRLRRVQARAEQLEAQNRELGEQVTALQSERSELSTQVSDTGSNLTQVTEELAHLKQISGKAVQLDADNRRLAEESESLRAEVDTLEAENQRLQDKLQSSAFIDGALAVLLGVIITLVVPRLWPKRRRSSGWA